MEIKDVKLIVNDPNKDYFVGLSAYSMGYGMDNVYTDGSVHLLNEEEVDSPHACVISVHNATYVAIESFFDMNEHELSKMKNHTYSITSSDPVAVIEENGLESIFNSGVRRPTHLSSANIYSKKMVDDYGSSELLRK